MIIVAGTLTIDPAKRELAMEAAIKNMTATREEEGCLDYVMTPDPIDEATIVIFERWTDGAAIAAHFGSPHMAEFQAAMGDFGITDMALHKYDDVEPGPLF
ncbi:MAG: antibiotic biosynthesis monooxygenase [Acidimicrobiales bacterium]|nr:antibiotic biosynthesis monooxygenase [Acidimicrobiales bacterium]